MTWVIWRESMSGKHQTPRTMELPKTIDEYLDKYPCGYSNFWRKIISERGPQVIMCYRKDIKGK